MVGVDGFEPSTVIDQLVDRHLGKVEAMGSNPIDSTIIAGESSSGKTSDSKPENAGSIPVSPAINIHMRIRDIISETEDQEVMLQLNWKIRHSGLRLIAHMAEYDIFLWRNNGRDIFYISQDDQPLGYLATIKHDGKNRIASAFITHMNQQQGLGEKLYMAILQAGFTLESDTDRSIGANALWGKLQRNSNLSVEQEDGRFIARIV